MASRIVQYFADKLRTVKDYPITLTKAVYDERGKRLDNKLKEINEAVDLLDTKLEELNGTLNVLNSNLIKHKFITPVSDTVTDNCIKTATRISVSIYHTAGSRGTHELFADGDSNYNTVKMYVNNEWFQDVFSVNKTTGTITRTSSSGLNWVRVSIDYI